MWQSGLEGDGYRFTGSGAATDATTPDNFICFGTTSVTDCKANEAKYLYRIIGVFEDNQGNNSVKLIKYKQLPTAYKWHNSNAGVAWENSDLRSGLNGNYYMANVTFNYMQEALWADKIANWSWVAANTLSNSNSGPEYNMLTTQQVYLYETNKTSNTITIGQWTTSNAKIGLMYASDYQMSLGSASLGLDSQNNYTTLKAGWMHQSNNDTTASTSDWTISRMGAHSNGYWYAWNIQEDGVVGAGGANVNIVLGIRPVFYLNSNVGYQSGTGDYTDPFIIN